MQAARLESTVVGAACWIKTNTCSARPFDGRSLPWRSILRNCPAVQVQRHHSFTSHLFIAQPRKNSIKVSSNGVSKQSATAVTATRPRARPTGGSGGKDPKDDPDNSDGNSFQIGLDPFSQQLIISALTAGAAWGIATWAHLDISSALRLDTDALAVSLQLSAPVLLLLLAVVAPRWAPPYKGSELERLRHNYYMTAQVLQLYLDFDDEKDEDGSSSSSSDWEDGGGSGGNGERARVRRRLRLEQTVGWGTISSGLALFQAFTLQPWNPPTANSVFTLALAGRTTQQLANEFLIRGAGWGLLSGWVAGELQSADASDGILFFGRVFLGGPDTVKYLAGLALVALALPGALWEARAARNFVRASVVGPVRDAAIFCTGSGVDEPAYCDPRGFAMMAARRPANAAPVADVVTRTRGWRSGPAASFSSVSSMGSVDVADLEGDEGGPRKQQVQQQLEQQQQHDTIAAATSISSPSPSSSSSSPLSSSSLSSSSSSSSTTTPRTGSVSSSDAGEVSQTFSPSAPSSASQPSRQSLPRVGPTLSPSSTAFEWDSEDMGVLLRVETHQDKIAVWFSLYYQLLAAFAINGAFLASDCNLLSSFLAAWLLRTGPLLLSELRARAAVNAAA